MGPKDNRNRGHRRWNRSRQEPPREEDRYSCPVCRRPLREIYWAITHRETGLPAHFDCILEHLRETTDLQPQERLCYLGGGSFGVIQYRNVTGPMHFFIRKRIQYEQRDCPSDWKKPLMIATI